jgi:hypothetical protein
MVGDELPTVNESKRSNFLGLSPNLWRLAFVLAIGQLSIGLWKWHYSIFLETVIEPWQMGLTFSIGTFAALIGSILSGTVTDFIGRKWTTAIAFIPIALGLLTMSYFPIWPLIPIQFGLIWYGMSTVRIMSRAIPADEIAQDLGRDPAKRIMMVMMPLWFVDGISPVIGSLLLNSGLVPQDLYRLSAFSALIAFFASALIVKESLGIEVVEKARSGPVLSPRQLGSDFWKLALGMVTYYFCWNIAVQYLGNLCVYEWNVDIVTYGLTWSTFSLTNAGLMYFVSNLTDRNLKAALVFGVAGNGLVYIMWSLGTGAPLMFILNFFWAIPFVIWIGAERSILILSVSDEMKGRALGTFQVLMSFTSIIAASFGAYLWEISGSLRIVYGIAGIVMLGNLLILIPLLKSIKI